MLFLKLFITSTLAAFVTATSANDNNHTKQSCNCVCGVRGRFNRIVGGQDANPHDHPWASGLFKNSVMYCGATIVSNNYLLTAAHCIYSFLPEEITVYVGGHKILDDRKEVKHVVSVVHHEKFDVVTFNNDIGLIKIETPLAYGPKVQPACLPHQNDPLNYAGEVGIVIGWGYTGENKASSSVLKYITIPIWSQEKCSYSGYGPKRLTSNMMCAGYEEGLYDACQGDSGGSMLRLTGSGSMEIIGVVSWGRGCARQNFPGVYTVVANYINWINEYLTSECICLRKQINNNLLDS